MKQKDWICVYLKLVSKQFGHFGCNRFFASTNRQSEHLWCGKKMGVKKRMEIEPTQKTLRNLLVPVDSVPASTNIPPVVLGCVWYLHTPCCRDWDRYHLTIAYQNRVVYCERQVNPMVVVLWIHAGHVVVHWKNGFDFSKAKRQLEILKTKCQTNPPKFFHRVKNDSPFISVGSKNLFNVSGNLTLNFCCTPLYRNDMSSEGVSAGKKRCIRFVITLCQSSTLVIQSLTCIVIYTLCR